MQPRLNLTCSCPDSPLGWLGDALVPGFSGASAAASVSCKFGIIVVLSRRESWRAWPAPTTGDSDSVSSCPYTCYQYHRTQEVVRVQFPRFSCLKCSRRDGPWISQVLTVTTMACTGARTMELSGKSKFTTCLGSPPGTAAG